MVYDHMVNYNGTYYSAGTDVPIDDNKAQKKPIDDVAAVSETTKKYTRSEINRMTTAELKNLAVSVKIPNAEKKTGGDLKKELIEFFNI